MSAFLNASANQAASFAAWSADSAQTHNFNMLARQQGMQQELDEGLASQKAAAQSQMINNIQAQEHREMISQANAQNMITDALTAQLKEAETMQRTMHEYRQAAMDKIEQRMSK